MKCSLEPAILNQELVNTSVSWFNDGSHDMKSTSAALFTATHHTGIFYADSLEKENNYKLLETVKTVGDLWKYSLIYKRML